MIKLNISYSKEEDVKRVVYTVNRWNFYKQHYNIDWLKLPAKLDKEKINTYSEDDILKSVEEEYPNNLEKVYRKVEQEIIKSWRNVSEEIEKVAEETGIKFPSELNIQLTCYGMGGSYNLPNNIVLLATRFNLVATIVHESIHLVIEDWIQKYKVEQPQKERIVDLFMSKYFGDMFPCRVIPKFSQQVYQKIDYHKIDEIFEKFEPDMEVVIREISEVKGV